MTANVKRLRCMTLSELCDERGILPGDTRQDQELNDEIAHREAVGLELLAAAKELLDNPNRVNAITRMHDAIAAAEGTMEPPRSFLRSVVREREVTKLQFCNFDLGEGRATWRTQLDASLLKVTSLAPSRKQDDARRKLRDHLVQIAGAAWRAARDLEVEDEIPF